MSKKHVRDEHTADVIGKCTLKIITATIIFKQEKTTNLILRSFHAVWDEERKGECQGVRKKLKEGSAHLVTCSRNHGAEKSDDSFL